MSEVNRIADYFPAARSRQAAGNWSRFNSEDELVSMTKEAFCTCQEVSELGSLFKALSKKPS